MTDLSPIERAIEHFGSETKLARAAGVTQVAINKAKRRGKASPDLALRISKATQGKVPLSDFIPEIVQEVLVQHEGSAA